MSIYTFICDHWSNYNSSQTDDARIFVSSNITCVRLSLFHLRIKNIKKENVKTIFTQLAFHTIYQINFISNVQQKLGVVDSLFNNSDDVVDDK